jgi:Galactose oxidase, central domain
MGTCCGSNRQGRNQSIYCIDPEGLNIIEYNIKSEEFFIHDLQIQLPAMAKYSEILPNKIFIAGGFKRLKKKLGESVSEVWIFEKNLGLVPKLNLSRPRTGHCIVSVYGCSYIISGVISHVDPTKDCCKYDYFKDAWYDISPISKPRVSAAGCSIGGTIYITGGNPGNSLQNYRDIEKYDTESNKWEGVLIKIPMDIWRHSCVPHKNGLMIFGGNGNRSHNLHCFKIDILNNIVIQHTWLAQGSEFQGCNCGENDKIYAFESTTAGLVWTYSNNKWTSKAVKPHNVYNSSPL